MKTLAIIMSVLAVTTVVYAVNEARLKAYYGNFKKCLDEKGGTIDEPSIDAAICAVEKDGKILNANGEYVRENAIQAIADAISDASTQAKAQEMYNKCHDEADASGVTGNEQAKKITMCTMPIIAFFDKL